jgi:hypothetical protein
LLSRYFHGRQLDVPIVAGAIRLVPDDLRGLCGRVLGRDDTLLEVPAGLHGQVELALERWACRVVERGTRVLQSGVHVMRKASLAGRPALGSLEGKGYNATN